MHFGNEIDFIRLAFSAIASSESCFLGRFSTSCRQEPEVDFSVTTMPAPFSPDVNEVLLHPPALEKEPWGVSLCHHLCYLEQTPNNDRNYLDEGGHLSNYSELH